MVRFRPLVNSSELIDKQSNNSPSQESSNHSLVLCVTEMITKHFFFLHSIIIIYQYVYSRLRVLYLSI